ncbi:uncharacterized protein PFLUO_LOCUS3889 [Penicillium psychrofluorescens]|uniref:uncharacterized protein n=1 Tax=Penicillium psychrofluorescens TaxID=3158075 RepID=UPI003CCD0D64
MDVTDATLLFEKKLGQHAKGDRATKEDIIQLTTALEFMPLAISQAAAYIKERAPRLSVPQYLKEFQKSNRKKISLLDHEGGRLRRDWEAKNSILITWQMSFDHIRQTRPSAANLISLMSFFDRQGIPEYLLRSRKERGEGDTSPTADDQDDLSYDYPSNDVPSYDALSYDDDDQSSATESSMDDEFEDDILTLRNYSLISISSDKTTFEMHRLVQLAMLKWLTARGQLEQWKQQFIEILCSKFPTDIYNNWEVCNLLFSHVQSAVTQRPENEGSLQIWADLLNKASWYAFVMENIIETGRMAIMAMKARKRILGPDNQQTLDSIEMTGLSYELSGQWRKAEELHKQVMETRKRALGPEHPKTLNSMINLAGIYRTQRRWNEAEELGVQMMEISKRVNGVEHPITLDTIASLAATYWNQELWKEAEQLELEVMESRRRVLGSEHPHTLNSIANLAATYWNQERWKEAEQLEVEVMDSRQRVLGPEHPSTLISMNNLACTWDSMGKGQDALLLMTECVRLRSQRLGPDHPDTMKSASILAEWQEENRSSAI